MSGIVGASVAAIVIAAVNASGYSIKITHDGALPDEPIPCSTARNANEAATVRIWDTVGRQSSGGSGVIVGLNSREALVLGCSHTHDGGGRNITVRLAGYEGRARIVARSRRRDLAWMVIPADPRMRVAKVANRQMRSGDRVTLTGFGGSGRGLQARKGVARSSTHVGARTDYGDSGGPAFVRGELVGIVWGNSKPGSAYGTSSLVPLRDVVETAVVVRSTQAGGRVYQHRNDTELCGLFPAVGRLIFANRGKRMGKGPWRGQGQGGCGPGGCDPGQGGGQGSGEPGPDDDWYAPGYGPDDAVGPNEERPAPKPGEPIVIDPPPGSTVEVDLSGLVQRPEFDALLGRFDTLATRADIEIVINRVSQLDDVVGQTAVVIGQIDTRLTAVEEAASKPVEPPPPVPVKSHWVVVADWSASSWPALLKQIEATRSSSGAAIDTVDSRRINGVVGSPQLIAYRGGVPSEPIAGDRAVALELFEIARGSR